MIDTDQIVSGIAAHAKWKYYLRQAIDTAESQWSVPAVRVDDQCEFGTWLSSAPQTVRLGEHWRTVKARHAEFHLAAAEVLELALSGRRDEAEAAIAIGSRFATASKQLTFAMMAWKEHATTQAGS